MVWCAAHRMKMLILKDMVKVKKNTTSAKFYASINNIQLFYLFIYSFIYKEVESRERNS